MISVVWLNGNVSLESGRLSTASLAEKLYEMRGRSEVGGRLICGNRKANKKLLKPSCIKSVHPIVSISSTTPSSLGTHLQSRDS
jgi:hypothetical protein